MHLTYSWMWWLWSLEHLHDSSSVTSCQLLPQKLQPHPPLLASKFRKIPNTPKTTFFPVGLQTTNDVTFVSRLFFLTNCYYYANPRRSFLIIVYSTYAFVFSHVCLCGNQIFGVVEKVTVRASCSTFLFISIEA